MKNQSMVKELFELTSEKEEVGEVEFFVPLLKD